MIHYTCDVCKAPMPEPYARPKQHSGDSLLNACEVSDVCLRCQQIRQHLDVPGILLKEWRSAVELAGKELAPNLSADAPSGPEPLKAKASNQIKFSGRFGKETQTIREKLITYREAHGLGCLDNVASKAGPNVTAFLLRDMLIGAASVQIEDWRRNHKAKAFHNAPKNPTGCTT
ncbi:MAG: hypothetical protein VB071_11780 [Lawsonibacter sp.]|nr:hypothetical protein [Lawsonibacter sp.]